MFKKPQEDKWLSTVTRKGGRRGLKEGDGLDPTSIVEKSLWLLCEEQTIWDKGKKAGRPVRQEEMTAAWTPVGEKL